MDGRQGVSRRQGSSGELLDGSEPRINPYLYTGPFRVGAPCTLRAVGYNPGFTQATVFGPMDIFFGPALTATHSAGGSVAIAPAMGPYFADNTATVTAVPEAGWRFLQWLGDAAGTNPAATLSMNTDRCVRALFGTSLTRNVINTGYVDVDPPADVYPGGAQVQLTAVPGPGAYFVQWTNAVSGEANPIRLTLTEPDPVVTAVFGWLPGEHRALTVLSRGAGAVRVNPCANVFTNGTPATLTALPEPGQSFVGWEGDSAGTQNPLVLTMAQSRVIVAQFTVERPRLWASTCLEGDRPEGFRLSIGGGLGEAYTVEASTNLREWTPLSILTNRYGIVQFLDPAATNLPARLYRVETVP